MLDTLIERIKEYHDEGKLVYIYGAGTYGKNLCKTLMNKGVDIDGFVITSIGDAKECLGKRIYSIEQIDFSISTFVIAMNENNSRSAIKTLERLGIYSDYYIDARPFIEHGGEKRGTSNGSIEITTKIGCSVDCRFCPQKLLLTRYFENDKKTESVMSLETFKKILDFFPKNYDISFGGMSEPFLNEKALDMIELACKRDRYVAVYTTLVGVTRSVAARLKELPVNWITIHVADKKKYAKIPTTEEYYEILDLFLNTTKANGEPLINMCNAQTTPDGKVFEICRKYGYDIFTEMTDRAGNLNESDLIQNNLTEGKIICGNSHNGELNSYIVLPDGRVVLCCMDYGLKHVLGNINTDSLNEIQDGEMMQYVRAGMDGDISKDILCRSCSMARMCF
ncbi:MAG: SPASM domain-containing protein [Butyrivibrio sp.]|nr:SPASM domain-containing protein [Butyrivibrio sp.]